MIRVNELHDLCSDKKVYIWGAMIVGQGVCRSLERNRIRLEAFLDKSRSLQGQKALGYPIIKPEDAFDTVRKKQGVIIAGSGHNSPEIARLCDKEGFKRGTDYILCEELNTLDPSVDVSGSCNLRCISCPRGNVKEQPPAGFMSADTYKLVLDKLVREIPLLGSIQLYAWGEPLLNKQLPEIVAITRKAKVLSAISSNLNYTKHLDKVIAEKPDWFKVSCSGWGKNYERTHTGGIWKNFHANLLKLVDLRRKHHPEMQIVLNYHLYKHNTGDDYRQMESLCNELGLIFIPNHAYLYPLDIVMDFVDGKPLSPEACQTLPMLLLPIEQGLAEARKRASFPCSEERCLPINWDCQVRECGVFFHRFIAENYLDTPLAELLIRRKNSALCRECKNRALQQYTAVYLTEKRPEEAEPYS